jgi:hypothetical protein
LDSEDGTQCPFVSSQQPVLTAEAGGTQVFELSHASAVVVDGVPPLAEQPPMSAPPTQKDEFGYAQHTRSKTAPIIAPPLASARTAVTHRSSTIVSTLLASPLHPVVLANAAWYFASTF